MKFSAKARFLVFLCALFFLPLLNVLSAESAPLIMQVDFIFHSQKPYLLFALAAISFYLLTEKSLFWKKAGFHWPALILGLGLFLIMAYSHLPFFQALESGLIQVDNSSIRYDRMGFVGTTFPLAYTYLVPSGEIARVVSIDPGSLPEEVSIKWYGAYSGSENLKVLLKVNSEEYDVTRQFAASPHGQLVIMEQSVSRKAFRNGENRISLSHVSGKEQVVVARQYYYYPRSIVSKDGRSFSTDDGVILLYVDDKVKPKPYEMLLFSFYPLFIILASALFFVGFFGIRLLREVLDKARLKLAMSIILPFSFFSLISLLEAYWKLLAKGALAIAYWLLGLFFTEVTYVTQGVKCQSIGVSDYVTTICKGSSGFESAALFSFLALIILLSAWNKVSYKRFMLFYFIGLLGTVVINAIRIFSITLIGSTISKEFALGFFHTNIGWVLFLGYSAVFWLVAARFVKR